MRCECFEFIIIYQLLPGFKPGKLLPLGVLKSFPFDLVYCKKSLVTVALKYLYDLEIFKSFAKHFNIIFKHKSNGFLGHIG